MISVKIIKDSTNWLNKRITTMILVYPRFIHSEFMTHRAFSRNAASSRAIPYKTLKEMTLNNPAIPIWTQNQKGMQGKIIEDEGIICTTNDRWKSLLSQSIDILDEIQEIGIHKQNINRALEPYQYITVLVTSTEWDNFLDLRDHKDAQPEIQILAREIRKALKNNNPNYLNMGEWHLPFIGGKDQFYYDEYKGLKVSVARCARISYSNLDGTYSTATKDALLFDKLMSSIPRHASPAEHQARVPTEEELDLFECKWTKKFNNSNKLWIYRTGPYCSNLIGWIQLRKLIENDLIFN